MCFCSQHQCPDPRRERTHCAYCTLGHPSWLCSSGSLGAPGSGCQMHWPGEEQELGCCAGLHIWRRVGVPGRICGWVGHYSTYTGNETMAESATASVSASSETQFGPEVLSQPVNPAWSGRNCEQTVCGSVPSFPHRHTLEETNKLPLSKSLYSLRLSCH